MLESFDFFINNLDLSYNNLAFVNNTILFNQDIKIQLKVRMTKEEKWQVKLTQIKKEILIGTLLGEAFIERNKPNHNARIRFKLSLPNHASYLMKIFSFFFTI
uniref:LAGLIDADG homing endonuclease n=1 Tax=Fomitiporia mediterranea TaxID=208960 RepID=A0A5B9RK65_9AGAM|nr:LAGLIDADG homing endonuclease [Fomitiporia mediterranea]QEG57067.1 LAGLIDADG homing endonuclease [Fomitiporia mediterranea]